MLSKFLVKYCDKHCTIYWIMIIVLHHSDVIYKDRKYNIWQGKRNKRNKLTSLTLKV